MVWIDVNKKVIITIIVIIIVIIISVIHILLLFVMKIKLWLVILSQFL